MRPDFGTRDPRFYLCCSFAVLLFFTFTMAPHKECFKRLLLLSRSCSFPFSFPFLSLACVFPASPLVQCTAAVPDPVYTIVHTRSSSLYSQSGCWLAAGRPAFRLAGRPTSRLAGWQVRASWLYSQRGGLHVEA